MANEVALRDRSADITRWVTECLDGLGVLAKPPSMLNPHPLVDFFQPIPLYTSEIEGERGELQDSILKKVTRYVREGNEQLRQRQADPSWGWKVETTKDVRAHPSWRDGMPHYACYLRWLGPRPRFWPLAMGCGVFEHPLTVVPDGIGVKHPSKKQRWFQENVAPKRKRG